MGRDKALIEVNGEAMALRVAEALAAAGADAVVAVGGDTEALSALGLDTISDAWPGEGPLGGLLTALRHIPHDDVFVVSCDLVRPSAEEIGGTVRALAVEPRVDVAVPVGGDGVRQWLHTTWRRRVLSRLERQFVAGERAIHRAVHAAGLVVVEVTPRTPGALADADTPDELPG